MLYLRILLILLVAAVGGPQIVGASSLIDPQDTDWSEVAREAKARHLPIAIFFTSPDCGYCAHLRREVLDPAFHGGRLSGRAILREFPSHAWEKITDFDGERIRGPSFVKRYDVFATPTLVLVAPNGEPLTAPLLGYAGSADYNERLEQALTQAAALLNAPARADAVASESH